MLAAVFAGDRRVWRVTAACAVPLVLLVCLYCALPRDYDTGTDSVAASRFIALPAGQQLCVPGLQIPANTARVRLLVRSSAATRPRQQLALDLDGRAIRSELGPLRAPGSRISVAVFGIPRLAARPPALPGSMCLTAAGPLGVGGTALPTAPVREPPTVAGVPLSARIAVWYLPRTGARSSYLSRAGQVLQRATLFRPAWMGAWLYVVLLLLVLPALAVAALRCLALAAQGRESQRLGAWLFALAALNFMCWALITPPFQAPDEEDHFAYAQALVERGQAPSQGTSAPRRRWSSAETLALEDVDFFTDRVLADTAPPWLAVQERAYKAQMSSLRPRASDGGGKQTAAAHGPLYYGALAPAYAAAGSSPFSQLTFMRLSSALLGALTVLFTFLLARELAPGRAWLGVLAALLVAYQPMYGFISGAVNNDVGVNACAAALALLLIRMLRRELTVRSGALAGVLLVLLPNIKGTGLSLYPVAGLVLLAVLWRQHGRADAWPWIALALGALLTAVLSTHALSALRPASAGAPISSNAAAVNGALHDIPDFLSYLWQVFLPRLPFMTRHFSIAGGPAFVIFVERGWASFGWYTVAFPPWVYVVILVVMLCAIPLGALAARMEWSWIRRHWLEVLAVFAMPVAVIVGFEAAYYTPGIRTARDLEEVGRYVFPAIAPLAVIVIGVLHAFGRRHMLAAGTALLVTMIALSYASQLLTLTTFYA